MGHESWKISTIVKAPIIKELCNCGQCTSCESWLLLSNDDALLATASCSKHRWPFYSPTAIDGHIKKTCKPWNQQSCRSQRLLRKTAKF